MSSDLSKNQVSVWSSPERSVCTTPMPSSRNLSFLETRPIQQGVNAMQQNWSVQLIHNLYAFLPFFLIPRVLEKIVQEQVHTMILVVPIWQTQPWYSRLLQLLIANSIIIPHMPNLLLNEQKEIHPLVANKTLSLAA